MHVLRSGKWLAVGLGVAAALACARARAAEYYVESGVEQNAGYQQDIGTGGGSGGSSGTNDSPVLGSVVKVKLGARTPNLDLSADTRFDYNVYTADTGLNSNNQYVTLNGNYQDVLTTYGLRGSYARTTTATTSFQDNGRGVRQNSRQQFLSVAPIWQREITPRNSVSFSPSYQNTHQSSKSLPDSESYGGTSTFSHSLTPTTTTFVSAYSSFYNSNSNGSLESLQVGGSLGISHQFSPTLSAQFSAGPVWVQQRNRLNSNQSNIFNFNANDLSQNSSSLGYQINSAIAYQMSERTGFSGSFTRSISPNTTSGAQQTTSAVSLGVNHSLLRQVSVAFRGYFARSEYIGQSGGSGSGNTRDYAEAAPSVTWQALPDLRFALTYRFRWQYFDDTNEQGNGSAVFASLIYDLPRLSMSR